MSERKEKPKGKSSKDRTPSKSIKPSKSSEPSKAKEGQSNPSESETTNDSSSEEENRLDQPERLLTVGALNVDSLLAKGKEKKVKALIDKHDLDILVVGESKLSNRKASADLAKLKIDNFTYVRQDRNFVDGNVGGGLLVYIRDGIEFTVDSFWEWPKNCTQFIEISITEPTRFDLVAIYSPPRYGHAQYVIDLMEFFLERNKPTNIPVMFVGDLNIDPERKLDKKAKAQLKQIHKKYNTKCLITQVTHVPKPYKKGKKMQPQSSCIDHIITDIPVNSEDVHVEGADGISCHKLVFCKIANEQRNSVKEQVKSISLLREPVNAQCLSEWLHNLVDERDIKYHLTVRHNGADDHVTITDENVRPLAELLNINNSTALKCESFAIEHKTTKSLVKSLEPLTHKVNGVDCFLLKCSSQNAQIDLSTIKHFMSEYFVCDGKLFSTDSKLSKYEQATFHKCPYCKRDPTQFQSAEELNSHITDEHPHCCHVEDCFKAFRTQQLVQKHVRDSHLQCIHAGCSKTFKSKQKLDSHVEKDHQVDNFKCRLKSCSEVFNNQKDRCKHEKFKHSPCTYERCPMVYKRACDFRKHSETHSIYWCRNLNCNQWFDNTDKRYAHENRNDGNHSVCNLCPKGERRAYTGNMGLQAHIRQKHNQ